MRVVPGSSQRPGRQEEPRAKSEMSRPQRQPYNPCFPQDPCPTSIFLLFLSQFSPASVHVLVTQSGPTLCDPADCSPRGSSVHGILQASILEWVTIPFSRIFFDLGIKPGSLALWADSLPSEPPRKPALLGLKT